MPFCTVVWSENITISLCAVCRCSHSIWSIQYMCIVIKVHLTTFAYLILKLTKTGEINLCLC